MSRDLAEPNIVFGRGTVTFSRNRLPWSAGGTVLHARRVTETAPNGGIYVRIATAIEDELLDALAESPVAPDEPCRRGSNPEQGIDGHWCTVHDAEWLLSRPTCESTPAAPHEEGLDVAWAAAEAALPEGWRLLVQRTDDDFVVWGAHAVSPAFYEGENESEYAEGYDLDPAAALRRLARALASQDKA